MEEKRKLKAEDILPYLPYDMHFRISYWGTDEVFMKMVNIDNEAINIRSTHDHPVYDIKPALIKLQDLTDEQWLNVFKAGTDWKLPEDLRLFRNEKYVILHVDKSENKEYLWMPSEDNMIVSYTFSEFCFDTYSYKRFNQIAAFRELYRLKADVGLLIDAGLAIEARNLPPAARSYYEGITA